MRLSVTTIEAYRLFRHEDWMSFDKFKDQVMGLDPGNVKMHVGTGLHLIAEGGGEPMGETISVEVPDWGEIDYHAQSARGALSQIPNHGRRELAHGLWDFDDIQVSGRVDWIHGNMIRDLKTTTSPINPDKYSNSYQWRFYLSMFFCDVFYYDVVHLREYGGVYNCKEYQPFVQYRYDGMKEDCMALARECQAFCKTNGIERPPATEA